MKILMLAQSALPTPSADDRIFAPGVIQNAIAEGLLGLGHDVALIAPKDSKSKAKVISDDILSTYELKPDNSPHRIFQHQLYMSSTAAEMMNSGKFDLLHINEFRVSPYFAKFIEQPIVCTHHGIPTKDHDLRGDIDRKRLKKLYDDVKFVSITNKQKELGKEYFNFIKTIHHGTDTSKFNFSEAGGESLLFVGRMVEGKNPHAAIDAAVSAGEKIKLYGEYDENSDYYKQMIVPRAKTESANIYGCVPYRNMPEVYQGAKALMFPITWDEAFGLVVIEAMACGTPVIAYDRGAMHELIVDGVTGFVVPEGDEKALANAIRNIGKIERRACREHVEENFSIEKMVKEYENLFLSLVKKG